MDRTAWIVIILCVAGLVGWEWWIAKQAPPRPAAVSASPAPSSAVAEASSTPAASLASPLPSSTPAASPAVTIPPSELRIEKLSNADVELDLTNAGGGIDKVILHNYKAEADTVVNLNSRASMPIWALVENPAAPVLPKYDVERMGDAVQFVYKAPENLAIRKKFFFPKANETRDNFLVELDVDLVNGGTKPFANAGYFVALGTAAPIHPRDYSYYTRLAWCIDGRSKGTDVNWFGGGGGLLG